MLKPCQHAGKSDPAAQKEQSSQAPAMFVHISKVRDVPSGRSPVLLSARNMALHIGGSVAGVGARSIALVRTKA